MRRGEPGSPALPVETGAFIRDGHFVSSDDTNVYAVQTLRGTIRRIGAEGRWTKVRNGGYETLVMGIAADDSLGRNLVQLTVSPASWGLSRHRDGDTPAQVAKGTFSPPLALNGTYRFEMDVADGSVIVRVPGVEKEVRLGPSACSVRAHFGSTSRRRRSFRSVRNSASTWCGLLSKVNRCQRYPLLPSEFVPPRARRGGESPAVGWRPSEHDQAPSKGGLNSVAGTGFEPV